MIIGRALKNMTNPSWTRPELLNGGISFTTASGQTVSKESAKQIATYYRCLNILTDDLAMIPLQQFMSIKPGVVERVRPDGFRRNMAYAVEVQPNPFQVPFVMWKACWSHVIQGGMGYLWQPFSSRQIYLLDPCNVDTVYADDGSIYYKVAQTNGQPLFIPEAEVMPLMINSENGRTGRGVLRYARETLGRRQAASETQAVQYERGLFPSAVATMKGEVSPEARDKVRASYWDAVKGTGNSGGVVVLDNKFEKFEFAKISSVDAQFLESINATDEDICKFFGLPSYKLGIGKQSYESNAQQDEDYLRSTLNPYLVQVEQNARIKWLTTTEQVNNYWRYNRRAFLRMNAKDQAEYLKNKILTGQYTPNQALAIDDEPSYEGGDYHYIPSNMAVIKQDGSIQVLSKDPSPTTDGGNQNA